MKVETQITIAEHEGRNALFAALAKAQGAFTEIRKNREVTIRPRDRAPYSFRYADLAAITEATRRPLSENGLFVIQPLNDISSQAPEAVIETILGHQDGGTITSRLRIANDFPDPKQFGAVVTYLRRYAVSSMLGIAADDDLDEDGNPSSNDQSAARQGDAAPPARKETAASRPKPGELPTCTPENFEKKREGWKRLVSAGKPVADMVAMIQTKELLTDEQKAEIASWAPQRSEQQ